MVRFLVAGFRIQSEFNMLNNWLEINQIQLGHVMGYLGGKKMGDDGLAC